MKSNLLKVSFVVLLAGCGGEPDGMDLTDERAESAIFDLVLQRNVLRQIAVPAPQENPAVVEWGYQVSDDSAVFEGNVNNTDYTWDSSRLFSAPGLPPGKETMARMLCLPRTDALIDLGSLMLAEGPSSVEVKIDAKVFGCPAWTLRLELPDDVSDELRAQVEFCRAAYSRAQATNPQVAEALYNGTFCQ